MDRRNFLKATGAVSAASAIGGCVSSANGESHDAKREAEQILIDEADKGWDLTKWTDDQLPSGFEQKAILGSGWTWWDFPREAQPKVIWASDEASVDYNHLLDFQIGPGKTFSLSSIDIAWLANKNSFVIVDGDKLFAFGLRGCEIESGAFDTGWREAIELITARPDHSRFGCIIGVADFTSGRVRAFSASTAPEAAYMHSQIEKNRGCNLLPTGLYAYRVGTHNLSATKTKQIGALRLDGFLDPQKRSSGTDVVVIRSLDNLRYDLSDENELWDRCQPYDNIHASIWAPDGDSTTGLVSPSESVFSSAGCQVIRGAYELDRRRRFTTTPTHEWAEFRKALGLHTKGRKAGTDDYGSIVQYMLLTGDEAWLAAAGTISQKAAYGRIRFGSSGEAAALAQKAVNAAEDGMFGPGSAEALLNNQIKIGATHPSHVFRIET